MSRQASMTQAAIETRPLTAVQKFALLAVAVTLAAGGISEATSDVRGPAVDVEPSGSHLSRDITLTKNELSFLVALNAMEQADITEFRTELGNWDFQPTHLREVLTELVTAAEIGFSRRTSSGSRSLTVEETDELLDTFTTVTRDGYFLLLTDTGLSKWKLEDWDITANRVRAIMFASDPRSVRIPMETREGT